MDRPEAEAGVVVVLLRSVLGLDVIETDRQTR